MSISSLCLTCLLLLPYLIDSEPKASGHELSPRNIKGYRDLWPLKSFIQGGLRHFYIIGVPLRITPLIYKHPQAFLDYEISMMCKLNASTVLFVTELRLYRAML